MLTLPETLISSYAEDQGPLKHTEVCKLHLFYGPNSVNTTKKRKWYHLLFGSVLHPFNVLLCLLAITSGIAGEYATMSIMLLMVFLSTALQFRQEWKSEVELESLLKFVKTQVTVIREDMVLGKNIEFKVASTELVPGDWVKLFPGDLIPADVELLEGKDFHVSQAALSGEALPVLKYRRDRKRSWLCPTEIVLKHNGNVEQVQESFYDRFGNGLKSIWTLLENTVGIQEDDSKEEKFGGVNFSGDLDRPDVCFMGSAVVSGKAICRVVNTGDRTHFGRLAKQLGKKPENNFQKGVKQISWLFFGLMVVMVPPVLLLQGFLNKDWFDAFMFALSVAVGLTPEMLPMIVNSTLAKGALEMSKRRCIVKQLDAIVNMGAIDVLCTDKTGTLTTGIVTLNKYVNGKGAVSSMPLLMGYLNSTFQTCHENPLDTAIIEYIKEYKINSNPDMYTGENEIMEKFQFIEEIPFDFVRRRISVIIQEKDENTQRTFLICKGAVEEILEKCGSVLNENFGGCQSIFDILHGNCPVETMSPEKHQYLNNLNSQLSEDGLRVIAVACKKMDKNGKKGFGVDDENKMIFCGYLAFLDPPKVSTEQAIKSLIDHSVNVKVLTGDGPLVCKKICGEIGLKVDKIITGQELSAFVKAEENKSKHEVYGKIAEEYGIFAKLTPIQKSDIVKALKMNGHVVGFLGDGINDAPALSEADVGISVDSGMDICKESADIILLEKDLTVIDDAVITGRTTYGNTVKYIIMGICANFGNVFSILVASAWLPFQPMTSLHILVQNLLYDVSQMAIPWDTMDAEYVMVPHRWSMKSVVRFMIMMGPWSSVFDLTTFLFLWFYFGIQSDTDIGMVRVFQSGWFSVGIVTQTLIVHMIRTPKWPFFQSCASWPMIGMTLVVMGMGLGLPYVPFLSGWIHLVGLPWEFYPFMVVVIFGYCVVAQMSKLLYLTIFREWY